jgi:hypothetical protein
VDPITAKHTPISDIVTHEWTGFQLCAMDDTNHVFYVLATNVTTREVDVVGFDVTTGDIVVSIPTQLVPDAFGAAMDLDTSNNDLIVVSANRDRQHVMLRVTPSTKTVTQIATLEITDVIGAHAFVDGLEWIQFATGVISARVIAVDTSTGEKVHDISDRYFTMDFNYDSQTKMIIGLGVDTATRRRTLVSLNPATQEFTKTHDLPAHLFFVMTVSALNPTDRLVYYYFRVNDGWELYDVDFDTGEVKNTVFACTHVEQCTNDLAYSSQ